MNDNTVCSQSTVVHNMVCDTYCRKITARELRKTFPKTDYIRVLYLGG